MGDEGPGRAAAPPSPLLAVPNVTTLAASNMHMNNIELMYLDDEDETSNGCYSNGVVV